jgi:protein subunit release factor A
MLDLKDLRIDRAPQPVESIVDLYSSAVTVTHIPTNTKATVDISSSQHFNRHIAVEMVEWALSYCPKT